jgi:MFS family permease
LDLGSSLHRRLNSIQGYFRDRFFYGWVIVAAGFLISVIGSGARYSFGVFLTPIGTEFSMSRGVTSSIFSIYMLLCALFAVFGGWGVDRYGPRKLGIFIGTFTGLSFIMTSWAQSPWQLLITYSLLLSLGTGPIYGVVNTTASRWFTKKRGFAVGITSSGGGVGTIVVAPFAAYLISSFGWRTGFIVLGVISLIGIVAVSFPLRKNPQDIGLLPDGDKAQPPQNDIQKKEGDVQPADFSLGQAIRMNQFWLLGFSWVFFSLSLHMIFVHIVAYAVDIGISPMDAAFILSLIGLASIPGRLLVGKLSDVMGRKALGVTCNLIQFGALLWLMWVDQLWMLYAFALFFGFMWGGSGIVITALIGDIFGTRSLGAIMGVMSAGWALGAAIGPAIGGFIFDVSGDYFMAFGVGAASLFTVVCLLALIRRAPSNVLRPGETQSA